MQRLYSMFPVGGPGLGLLLMRLSLVASMIYLRGPVIALVPHPLGIAAVIAISLCLSVGLLTPMMAAFGVLCGCVALLRGTLPGPWCMAPPTLDAVAICLLGPGAFSVDAVLYGRHLVVTTSRKK